MNNIKLVNKDGEMLVSSREIAENFDKKHAEILYAIEGRVSKDEFDTAMSEIEDKYLDNVRDMLLGYCDVMDRMNQWRSRLFW